MVCITEDIWVTPTSSTLHPKPGEKRGKHVPIALTRQRKGMCDWVAASVRRRWNTTSGRNLRSCTFLPGLLSVPALSPSLYFDPSSLSYHGCSLLSHCWQHYHALLAALMMWNQTVFSSCSNCLKSASVCLCVCVCSAQQILAKKLSHHTHKPQANFWFSSFGWVFPLLVSSTRISIITISNYQLLAIAVASKCLMISEAQHTLL